MTRMFFAVSLTLVLGSVMGCRTVWVNPGASSAKYQADIYQCRYGTEAPTDKEIRSGDLPPVSARRDWKECMALLGWTTRVGMRSSEPYSN